MAPYRVHRNVSLRCKINLFDLDQDWWGNMTETMLLLLTFVMTIMKIRDTSEKWKTILVGVNKLLLVLLSWHDVRYAVVRSEEWKKQTRRWRVTRFSWNINEKTSSLRRHIVRLRVHFRGGPLWLISVLPQSRLTSHRSLRCIYWSKDAASILIPKYHIIPKYGSSTVKCEMIIKCRIMKGGV